MASKTGSRAYVVCKGVYCYASADERIFNQSLNRQLLI
jgi:NADH:ubiquinone oxidoreductase subunit E